MGFSLRIFLFAGVLMVAGLSAQPSTRAQTPIGKDEAFVHNGFVRVIDGDTVEIWRADRRWGIGLIGIDAPEGNTACGMSATARMWELTAQGARFRSEAGVPDEKYRLMYHANTLDDQSIEAVLVSEGLAKVVSPAGKEGARLKALEADARRDGKGCVWGGKGGPPPTKRKFPPTTESKFDPAVEQTIANGADAATSLEAASVVSVPGFQDRFVIGGFTEPTTFEFAPDGRIFVAEKHGLIRVVKNGQLLPTPLLDISSRVNDYWDHGLIGLAFDPDFASNGYIYVVYTYENDAAQYSGGKTGRLSRFTVAGDVASPSSEFILMGTVNGSGCAIGPDCIPSEGASHSVGNVRFGPDGKLYATFGDASSFVQVDDNALRAQNVDSLAGKVVRINPDGTGVPDNPYWNGNPTSNRSKVWAYGARNAFRFNFNPDRGSLYLGDVGWNEREEINLVGRGSNLGWPCYEGSVPQAGYESKSLCQTLYGQGSGAVTSPLVEWTHNEDGCCGAAAVGGAFTTSYTAPYDKAYFYSDYSKEWIRYFKVDANDSIVGGIQPFLTGGNGPVSLQRGPSGDIYYLAINTGEIRHIQQGSGNQAPTAVLTANPTDGLAPLAVSFSAVGSSDPNVDPLTFQWDFGDGQQGTGLNTSHTYTQNGTYTAVLTVRDPSNATDTRSTVITVGNRRPTVAIQSPTEGMTYVVGQVISLQGSGSDPDDGGALPGSSLSWSVTLFHNTHQHPFLTAQGASTSFEVPDHGDNTYFEITLDGVDSGGLHAQSTITIRPVTVQLTLNTSPAGLDIVYDGVRVTAPYTATSVANSSHTIEAPSPQGTSLFSAWSDGGAEQHNITLGSVDEARTATFRQAAIIDFNGLTNPNRNFSGQYPSGVANWPTGAWYLSGPWGSLATNSLSFQSAGQTSGTFSFLTPRVLLSVLAYNGGGASSTVTLACAGNTTRSQNIAVGQTLTIPTNWTTPCTTVTVTSSNGWDTNFDDFVHDSGGAPDTSPPTISNLQANTVTQSSAVVTWTTDEASSTQVEYGTSASYGAFSPASPDTSPVTSHSRQLTGLAAGTTYHYRVLSRDAAGNLATSGDATFTTLPADATPPVITGVSSGSVTQTTATITWSTDEPSTSQVEYGPTVAYGSLAPASPNTTLVTSHSQGLGGLAAGTSYHYRVLSRDAAGNLAVSGDFQFATTPADTTPPAFSNVQASVTDNSATIDWTTDEASTTQVEYGLTTAYGSFAPATVGPSLTTSHSQALIGLAPGTTYHYRVLSADAQGNAGVSGDFSFTTLADSTPPTVTGVQASNATQTTATISWTTNEASTTQVEYGTTTAYGAFSPASPDPALMTAHSRAITNLAPGTLYHFRVLSQDAGGNLAVSGDFTFTTAPLGGGAWRFDGSNDRATATDSNSLDLTGPLTLEAWVKFDSLGQNKWHTIIFKQGLSNNLAYALYYHNGIWFEIKSGSGYFVLEDKKPLQTGVWYHIAAVYDRVTMRTYVNGQLTASLPFTGAVSTSTFALTLGYNNVWSNEQLAGTIDEVRISSDARYSSNFVPSGAFTTDANTRALWHFDESEGQTTADASGNGNTLRRGTNLNSESSDPTWVAGAPLILAAVAPMSAFEVLRRGRRHGNRNL